MCGAGPWTRRTQCPGETEGQACRQAMSHTAAPLPRPLWTTGPRVLTAPVLTPLRFRVDFSGLMFHFRLKPSDPLLATLLALPGEAVLRLGPAEESVCPQLPCGLNSDEFRKVVIRGVVWLFLVRASAASSVLHPKVRLGHL